MSLGGVDSRTIAQSDLRRRVGWVPHIFNASVRDNLTLFKPGIPDEGLLRTLEDLGLGDWLRTLPHGLDTELSPGDSLSAGESQILALARVFLKDPGLVILDEASSRLDPATEYLVQRAIKTLLSGRTGIIIAHRWPRLSRWTRSYYWRMLVFASTVREASSPTIPNRCSRTCCAWASRRR